MVEIESKPVDWFSLKRSRSRIHREGAHVISTGVQIPVLARRNGQIVHGERIVQAARAARKREVEVIVCDGWTVSQVKVFEDLAHGPEAGHWTLELLKQRLSEIEARDPKMSIDKLGDKELRAVLTPISEVAKEIPESLSLVRLKFLQAAQRICPEFGQSLKKMAGPAPDDIARRKAIREWQARYELDFPWVHECAHSTLTMWNRDPEAAARMEWCVGGSARNRGERGVPVFRWQIEREFSCGLDLGMFKHSIHDALEAALDEFGSRLDVVDLGIKRWPKDLNRALECLALQRLKNQSIREIALLPGHFQDVSNLSRDIRAVAELIGIAARMPGRPKGKVAAKTNQRRRRER